MSHKYDEDLREAAIEIAIQAGAITECDICEGTYLNCCDDMANSKAYALATKQIKEGLIYFERVDILNEINNLLEESLPECYACQNWD